MPDDLLELTKPFTAGGYKVVTTTDGLADLMMAKMTSHCGSNLSVSSVGNPLSSRTREGWSHDMAIVGFDDTDEARSKFGGRIFMWENSWGNWNSVSNIPEYWKPWGEGMFAASDKDTQYAVGDGGTVCFYEGKWFDGTPIDNSII